MFVIESPRDIYFGINTKEIIVGHGSTLLLSDCVEIVIGIDEAGFCVGIKVKV